MSNKRAYFKVKRLLDIVLALILIGILLPLILVVATIIKVSEPKAPVIFKQKRVGRNNKLFTIYKFRTMKPQTPDIPTHLLDRTQDYTTKVGTFLRKTSIDEIPQLWNILKGEMSFIGPRPALYNQEDLIELREQYNVHKVRPGLTGLAQIHGRDELSIESKACWDGIYVRDINLILDIKIFIKTIVYALRAEGVIEKSTMENRELHKEAAELGGSGH